MPGATFDDVESFGALKELYAADSYYQEHVQSSLYEFIRHAGDDEVEFDGNYFNVQVIWQLNESFGAINDDERIPDPGFPKSNFAKYRPKLNYSALEATTYAATRGHKNGRVNGKYLDDMIKGTLLSFMSNLDFDCYGNGRGLRATVLTATPAASSFTVEFSTRIRAGAKLDWYDSTLTTKRGSIAVDLRGVDRINRTVYIDSSFGSGAVPSGATAGDVLVVADALKIGEPSDGRHIAGLDRITDASVSIGGLAPSSYALWLPTNIAAGGANPNQEILQQMWDSLYIISGVHPNRMAFNQSFKRGYLNGFLNQRRFNSNSFDTGASNITFTPVKMGQDQKGQKPVEFLMLEDKNCDPENVYIWNYDAFCVATDYGENPHLANEDQAEFRFRQGYDSMSGFYRFWFNTVTKQRNAIGKISGFATASGTI